MKGVKDSVPCSEMTVGFNSLDFGHWTHKAWGLSSFITEACNFKETLAVSGQPKGPMKQKQMAVEKNPTTLR